MSPAGQLKLRLGALELRLDCENKRFVAGDHWLALLREHPEGRPPELLSSEPVGIVHRYLRLLTRTAAGVTYPQDAASVRRLSYPALTELVATRIGYDPTIASARWRDINESGVTAPATVQDALDQLAANVEAADITCALPGCGESTVEALLSNLPHWPDLDQDGVASVQDLFKAFLCHLDASRVPYSANAAGTIKTYLDQLRTDVEARVKIAGDTMTGSLIVNAQLGINEPKPGGNLHVKGGHAAKSHHAASTAIEIDHAGDGNVALQANGPAAPFRLAIQDGNGRANQTWNAYDSAGEHRFDAAGEGATWLHFGAGALSVHTAEPGAADAVIPWNRGLHQTAAGFVGVGTATPADRLDVNGRVAMSGFRMPTGAGEGLVLTSDAQGVGTWKRPHEDRRSRYSVFKNLRGAVTVTSSATKLNTGTHTFTKAHADTAIEVQVQSCFFSGTFQVHTSLVAFFVRVDDLDADMRGNAMMFVGQTEQFLSFSAVFTGLAAGDHTVSIWATAVSGSVSGVEADRRGAGTIIVKEVW